MAYLTKRGIINQIEHIDESKGRFHQNGQYRYGVKFYYGNLGKYNKDKLMKILKEMEK